MTWNIHGAVGSDRRCDVGRVVDLIRRHRPDLAALQEVDSRRPHIQGCDPFQHLPEALGGRSAQARTIVAPDGSYGHMLVSRFPISSRRIHDIAQPRREPRAAIEATVETPFGPLRVVAAHLGLSGRERRRKGEALAAIVDGGSLPVVLMGDLNDWLHRGAVNVLLREKMPERTHLKTFPARLPLFALDRIHCLPAGMMVRNWTDPAAREASDHLPVIADLLVPETG